MRDEGDCPLNSRGVLACDSGLRDQDLNPSLGVKSEIGKACSYSGNSPHQRPKKCFTVKGLPPLECLQPGLESFRASKARVIPTRYEVCKGLYAVSLAYSPENEFSVEPIFQKPSTHPEMGKFGSGFEVNSHLSDHRGLFWLKKYDMLISRMAFLRK